MLEFQFALSSVGRVIEVEELKKFGRFEEFFQKNVMSGRVTARAQKSRTLHKAQARARSSRQTDKTGERQKFQASGRTPEDARERVHSDY